MPHQPNEGITIRAREADLQEYQQHVLHGGWRLGLLVARNVGPWPKLTAEDFADQTRTKANRAKRYLAAWDLAAAAGYVPASADVAPGQDVQLPVDEDDEIWRTYYRSDAGLHVQEHRRQALDDMARERGVGASKVRDIASNPKAMAAAIEADEDLAEAALDALGNRARRIQENRSPRREGTPSHAPGEEFWGPSRMIGRLHGDFLALQREAKDWNDEQRRFAAGKLEPHRHTVGMLIDMLNGLDDSALSELLREDNR